MTDAATPLGRCEDAMSSAKRAEEEEGGEENSGEYETTCASGVIAEAVSEWILQCRPSFPGVAGKEDDDGLVDDGREAEDVNVESATDGLAAIVHMRHWSPESRQVEFVYKQSEY